MAFSPEEMDVIKLLTDYAPYIAPWGSARALEETGVATAGFGPAGYVEPGVQHLDVLNRGALKMLRDSLRKLSVALRELRKRDHDAWASLIPFYTGEDADPGRVAFDRERLRGHDEENRKRRSSGRVERLALVTTRTQLERHDTAIRILAEILKGHELHPAPTRVMTEREHEAGEKANAEIYAVYQRYRVSGQPHSVAVKSAATSYHVSEGTVERIIEFRSELVASDCRQKGCDDPAHQQGLCVKHYWSDYRERKKLQKAEKAV